jgi:hypothetical protein
MKGPFTLRYSRLNEANQDRLRYLWQGHQIWQFPHGTGQNLRIRAQRNAVAIIAKQRDGTYRHSLYHVLDPHPFERMTTLDGKRVVNIPIVVDVRY